MFFYDRSVAELREEIRTDYGESRRVSSHDPHGNLQSGFLNRPLGTPGTKESMGAPSHGPQQRDIIARCLRKKSGSAMNATRAKENPHFYNKVIMSERCCRQMLEHAISGGDNEIMGMLVGTTIGSTFVVLQTFELPVLGTETRVNAMSECYEYMVQYMDSMIPTGPDASIMNIVGWYHSHPGYDCWLSNIDMQTQQLNQSFQDPYLAVVVDPKKSVSDGAVRIGAYRTVKTLRKDKIPREAVPANEPEKLQRTDDLQFYELPITMVGSELDDAFTKDKLKLEIHPSDRTYETKMLDNLFDSMKQIVALNEVIGNSEESAVTKSNANAAESSPARPLNPGRLKRTMSSSMQSTVSVDEESDIDMIHEMYSEKDADVESVTSSIGTVPDNHMSILRPHSGLAQSNASSTLNLQTLQRRTPLSSSLLDGIPATSLGTMDSGPDGVAFRRPTADDLTLTLQRDNLSNSYTRNKRELLRYKLQEYKNLRFYRDTFTL